MSLKRAPDRNASHRGLDRAVRGCGARIPRGRSHADKRPRDLYFGEAIYYAQQGLVLRCARSGSTPNSAQHRGLDEPASIRCITVVDEAEFSVGDFELDYRMHLRAGRAITAVLEGTSTKPIRNDAAYRFARIQFQKGQLADALQQPGSDPRARAGEDSRRRRVPACERLPVYRPRRRSGADAEALQDARRWSDSPPTTSAMAYLLGDDRARTRSRAGRAGQVGAPDEETMAIRDKSNLVLGTLLVQSSEFDEAKQSLERVRLDGPFSNQALLRPVGPTRRRSVTKARWCRGTSSCSASRPTPSVQEAMLALPYAYASSTIHGRAALLYARRSSLTATSRASWTRRSTASESGRFLKALVREEVRQDKDWVIRLRSLPEVAGNLLPDGAVGVARLPDGAAELPRPRRSARRLDSWQRSFDAYEDLIGRRRAYYEPVLPGLDQQFRSCVAADRNRSSCGEGQSQRSFHGNKGTVLKRLD